MTFKPEKKRADYRIKLFWL